jgi:hypothetical protein
MEHVPIKCLFLLVAILTHPSFCAARVPTRLKSLVPVSNLSPILPPFRPPSLEVPTFGILITQIGMLVHVSTRCLFLLAVRLMILNSSAAKVSMPPKLQELVSNLFLILPLFRPPSLEGPTSGIPTTMLMLQLAIASTRCPFPTAVSLTHPSFCAARALMPVKLQALVSNPSLILPLFHPPSLEVPTSGILIIRSGARAHVSTRCLFQLAVRLILLNSRVAKVTMAPNLREHALPPCLLLPLYLPSVPLLPRSFQSGLDGRLVTVITTRPRGLLETATNMSHRKNAVMHGFHNKNQAPV